MCWTIESRHGCLANGVEDLRDLRARLASLIAGSTVHEVNDWWPSAIVARCGCELSALVRGRMSLLLVMLVRQASPKKKIPECRNRCLFSMG